eukprot:Pgem_evm1s14118
MATYHPPANNEANVYGYPASQEYKHTNQQSQDSEGANVKQQKPSTKFWASKFFKSLFDTFRSDGVVYTDFIKREKNLRFRETKKSNRIVPTKETLKEIEEKNDEIHETYKRLKDGMIEKYNHVGFILALLVTTVFGLCTAPFEAEDKYAKEPGIHYIPLGCFIMGVISYCVSIIGILWCVKVISLLKVTVHNLAQFEEFCKFNGFLFMPDACQTLSIVSAGFCIAFRSLELATSAQLFPSSRAAICFVLIAFLAVMLVWMYVHKAVCEASLLGLRKVEQNNAAEERPTELKKYISYRTPTAENEFEGNEIVIIMNKHYQFYVFFKKREIANLTSLTFLKLKHCYELQNVDIANLTKLSCLELKNCKKLQNINLKQIIILD